jgi:BirA family biotin operon repressor/biotin-[acetyl-CoA-carboxylase] ligase
VRVDGLVGKEGLSRLARTRFGQVVQLAETGSTNTVLAAEARAGAAEGLVVVADHQESGRGRFSRSWESPAGMSLLFSVLLRPAPDELPPERRHLVVAAVSLAMVEAARIVADAHLSLKWPNDLLAPVDRGEGKVAGVLAEVVQPPPGGGSGAVVVGMGVNVHWAPSGMAATCLDALAGREVDRGELLVEALSALELLYGDWERVSRLYRQSCSTVGRRVSAQLGTGGVGVGPLLTGTATGVDGDGALVVRTAEGQQVRVAAGDVFHLSAVAEGC